MPEYSDTEPNPPRNAQPVAITTSQSGQAEDETAVPIDGPEETELSFPPVATADAPLQALEAERRKHRLPGMRLGYLLASWCIIVPYLSWLAYTSFTDKAWQNGVLYAMLAALATQMHRITLTPRQTELAQQLAQCDDVQAVGQLAEALEWPDKQAREAALSALIRLLPRLKASDAGLLNLSQRACLYQGLNASIAKQHPAFVKSLLKALEQVGDRDALPGVERLANGPATGWEHTGVQEAARDCLPFLRVRIEQTHSSQTLLRASSAMAASPEQLLRPATGLSSTDPNQLLRASPQGDSPRNERNGSKDAS